MKIRYGILIPIALLGILFLAGSASAAVDFPADEAGISAYVNAKPSGINLETAKENDVFVTIERETSDYFIGTVAIDMHTEEQYPHVYVSSDGWVVAYYPEDRESSWIFPWSDYAGGALSATTLSNAVTNVASAVGGSTASGIKYYDFRHPDATKMMIIMESVTAGTNYFHVTIPTSFSTYAVYWSHYNYHPSSYDYGFLYLNEVQESLIDLTGANYGSFIGKFDNGVEHTIKICANSEATTRVGLVLEYAE